MALHSTTAGQMSPSRGLCGCHLLDFSVVHERRTRCWVPWLIQPPLSSRCDVPRHRTIHSWSNSTSVSLVSPGEITLMPLHSQCVYRFASVGVGIRTREWMKNKPLGLLLVSFPLSCSQIQGSEKQADRARGLNLIFTTKETL